MRITTKKGREFAFKLRAIRNARTGQKKWFVGITTKEYFWLDLETPLISTAECLANVLRGRLSTDVYIFMTTKSFWLVTKKKLLREKWNREYEFWLGFKDNIVCEAFCKCCIRYHKATLRVSAKKGKRPKLVKVIHSFKYNPSLDEVMSRLESNGLPVTPRLRNLHLTKARGSHNTLETRLNINTSILLVGEYGAEYWSSGLIKSIKSVWRNRISLHKPVLTAFVQALRHIYRSNLALIASKSRVLVRKVQEGQPLTVLLVQSISDLLKI